MNAWALISSPVFAGRRRPFLISVGCGMTPGRCVTAGFSQGSRRSLIPSSFPFHYPVTAEQLWRVRASECQNFGDFILMRAWKVGKPDVA